MEQVRHIPGSTYTMDCPLIGESEEVKVFRVVRDDGVATPWFRIEESVDDDGRQFTPETMFRGYFGIR